MEESRLGTKSKLGKGSPIEGAWSKLFVDYKPSYFSKLIKSTKAHTSGKIVSHIYWFTERGEIPSELK